MSADAFFEAYEKGKNLGVGTPEKSNTRADAKIKWRSEWNREESVRVKGYVCAKCDHFRLETDHPLSNAFPDLGMCEKLGVHRFGSASCRMGRWDGRRRPDAQSSK